MTTRSKVQAPDAELVLGLGSVVMDGRKERGEGDWEHTEIK